MSDLDSNPFADPQAANPFADPAVQQAAARTQPAGMEDFNPFADQATTRPAPAQINTNGPATKPSFVPPPQPAVMHASDAPPPYSTSSAQPAITTDELQRRQEELDRKAAELQRKEEAMKNMQYAGTRQNNFPPLPAKCCVTPCFYQDFAVDIPVEFQRLVKMIYYLWLFYVFLLLLNLLGTLAYFIASSQDGHINNSSGASFGVAILYVILFAPCSFVCWYRPLYKAFRSDSSFNFFFFFFVFFFQIIVTIINALGFDGWGTCGFISGLDMMSKSSGSAKAVAGIMLVIGVLFALTAVAKAFVLLKVHRIYRSTGASFEKAQAEFSQGVMTNRGVQQAASSVGQNAARGMFQGATSDNRY